MSESNNNEILTEHTPQIASEQKNKKRGSGLKMLCCIVAIILILMICGKQILGVFLSKEDPAQQADENFNEVMSNKLRSDLGSASYNPFADIKTDKPDVTIDDDEPTSTTKPEAGFKKYLNTGFGDRNTSSVQRSANDTNSTSKSSSAEQPPQQVESITFDPNLYLEEGTFIPCTLRTRFVSDIAGKIECVISQNIYSANGNTVLIEAGTKARGSYKSATLKHGQGRMFVIWERLQTPNYKKINFYNSQVVGQLGEAGIDGWIDTHFWDRFGNAMLLSVIDDVAAAVSDQVVNKDRNVDYTENSRDAMAEMAKVALENSVNIPPTIYKNQGDVIGILVGDDIDFSNVYQLKVIR